ncbi:hypothetical protein M408DRAFT_328606 [Serendipita vermifera MAFF 305830]|uniref:Uncharacterized protein n=1 Tax=Serendipita vermifera MAFF 305830 TaxID=933852 RepID=A0A0C3BE70_SERVB|nr:hypothetical protein M408DRAFT_334069 [Serendipita vermifera MAFF 305830]KIM29761.1 hypothetical protein M408DRAFT_328606 [Serendipita vermifera MAFF 305830]
MYKEVSRTLLLLVRDVKREEKEMIDQGDGCAGLVTSLEMLGGSGKDVFVAGVVSVSVGDAWVRILISTRGRGGVVATGETQRPYVRGWQGGLGSRLGRTLRH